MSLLIYYDASFDVRLKLLIIFLLITFYYWYFYVFHFHSFLNFCLTGNLPVVQSYLTTNINFLNRQDNEGMTCLINASKTGHLTLVKYLVSEEKAQLNIPQANHHALRGCALNNHYIVCKYLLDSGAKVNEFSSHQTTALMGAARNGHLEMFQLLIQYGADCSLVNEFGETAKDLFKGKEGFKCD